MPATNPTTLKLTEAERDRLRELGRMLGIAGRPLSMSEVMRLAVDRLWQAETANGRKTNTPAKPGR